MIYADVQIRATHPYGFRSGQWAIVIGVVWSNEHNRPCYKVIFPEDAVVDFWPLQDTSDSYEFRKNEPRRLEH